MRALALLAVCASLAGCAYGYAELPGLTDNELTDSGYLTSNPFCLTHCTVQITEGSEEIPALPVYPEVATPVIGEY